VSSSLRRLISLAALVGACCAFTLFVGGERAAAFTCTTPSDAYATAVTADSPLLYYPLSDGGAGLTMCDASGNSRNGSYNSTGVTWGVSGPLLSDTSQTAVAGDGTSASEIGQGGADTLSGDVSFTMEGWYRSTGTTPSNGTGQILVGLPGAQYAFGLGIWHNVSCGSGASSYASTLGLDEQGVSNCWDTSTAGVNLYDGSWHYLAIAYDSTSRVVTAYVDGQSLGAQPLTAVDASTQFAPSGATFIGNWPPGGPVNLPWTGDAAQIAVYGTALSSARIQAHYAAAGYGTSSDDTLSALSTSAGSPVPSFSSATNAYTLSVPNATSSTTVTATASNNQATLSLTSPSAASLTSGTASASIPLAVGQTTITVHVLAQDGSTAQNYTIAVTRAAAQHQQQQPVPTPTPASQTITFTSPNPSPAAVGTSYTPTAASNSGLAVTITLDPTSTGCTLTSGTVTFTNPAATCILDANQAGNKSYTPAAQAQQTITTAGSKVTVDVSGFQVFGSSSPVFTGDDSSGPSTSGTLSCTTVDGGTPISRTLPVGTYTIDPASCSGLSSSDPNDILDYVAVSQGFAVTTAGGGPLLFAPAPLGLGVVPASEWSEPVSVTVTNDGADSLTVGKPSVASVDPSSLTLAVQKAPAAAGASSSGDCSATLKAGASCTLALQFEAATGSSGAFAASINVEVTGGHAVSLPASVLVVSGTAAAGPLLFAPAPLGLGVVPASEWSEPVSVTVTNDGADSLTVGKPSVASVDPSSLTLAVQKAPAAAGASSSGDCSATLKAGASCTLALQFEAATGSSGAFAASINVEVTGGHAVSLPASVLAVVVGG
jgi:hypothetical protein